MSRLLTLHDPEAARRYYQSGVWTGDTFYTLMAGHAAVRPDAWAARDGARRLTWGQLKRWVDAVAADMAASGLREGERVSLWMSNRLEALVAFLACSRNGYVCNPSLHRNYTVEEILGLVERIRASALFIEEGFGADAVAHDVFGPLASSERVRKVYRLPAGHDTGTDMPGIGAPVGKGPAPLANPDKVTYLAFTSGTTGAPKGVMHSDNTLLANCRDLVADWHHNSETILLTLSPLSHHIAWVAVGQAMIAGMELVVDDPPPGRSKLDWVIETGATYVMGVPTHAMDMLAEQKARGIATLGSVNLFYMAGSPIPPATAEAFLVQGVRPQNIYGMSENSSHQYTHPTDDADTVCSTCGTGGKAYRIRIYDQENPDIEVGTGVVGQIGGMGGCLMLGYFDNQAATEDSFNAAGDFLSGDLGMLDERGNLHVVGRLKDMIIRGGHNIFPAKIEDLAIKHPGVAKAAAFPVPDERLGERVCLSVLATGEGAPPPGDLLRHLFDLGLSKYDMPEFFLEMPEFPLTASGKILKRELAEWAKTGRIKPTPVRFVEPK
jgi:acyl-CoA synthetase